MHDASKGDINQGNGRPQLMDDPVAMTSPSRYEMYLSDFNAKYVYLTCPTDLKGTRYPSRTFIGHMGFSFNARQ